MKQYDVLILTEARYENPKETNWYINNVLQEDQLVQTALERKGLKVNRLDWATKDFDWTCAHTAIFRTTWDYFDRFDEFLNWLDAVESKLDFINPIEQVRWNIDKHYLLDLKAKGINIPPTIIIEKGQEQSLKALMKANQWEEAVLKPTVSGAARHTYRINMTNVEAHESLFQELIGQEAMMLQAFQKHILEKGEVSLMMIDGAFSHAILKIAKKGDFRVQDDHGGTVHAYTPSKKEIEFAKQAIRACPILPTYARVDIMLDNNNQLALAELELIEPEFWFRQAPEAADKLANAVLKRLNR